MNFKSVLSAFTLILFSAGICHADSLVITYRSGKTQTIVLDEPSQGINSWQFVGGTAQRQSQKQDDTVILEEVQKQSQTESKPVEKAAEKKKSGIRMNWNAKPLPD